MRRHRRGNDWFNRPGLWFAGTAALMMGAVLYKFFPEMHRYVRMKRM